MARNQLVLQIGAHNYATVETDITMYILVKERDEES